MGIVVPIAELARVLHRRDAVWRSVVVLKAYFDESGTHGGSLITAIGGWIGTEQTWSELEQKWLAILTEYADKGVRYFHMAEALAQEGQFCRVDKPSIDYIITQCTKLIGESKVIPLFCAVVNEHWERVVHDPVFLARFPKPINLCFENLLHTILDWSRDHANSELVVPMFAVHTEFTPQLAEIGHLYTANERTKKILGSLAFDFPERVIPLQVADFLAHQIGWQTKALAYNPLVGGAGTRALHWATGGQFVHGNWFDADGLCLTVKKYCEKGVI
ncbi:MAG: DUF3800 domain-containing protein [Rhodospirillaceae bacterium]|nr:MAG: DUF3800 domain-containing protein [Rhodospirillaceae bacterium]